MVPAASFPPLQKNARTGHPLSRNGKRRRIRSVGHPPSHFCWLRPSDREAGPPASGNILGRYVDSSEVDDQLSELRSSTISYYEQDGIGSLSSLTNSATGGWPSL